MFKLLSGRLDQQLSPLEKVLDTDAAALNTLLQAAKVDPIKLL